MAKCVKIYNKKMMPLGVIENWQVTPTDEGHYVKLYGDNMIPCGVLNLDELGNINPLDIVDKRVKCYDENLSFIGGITIGELLNIDSDAQSSGGGGQGDITEETK